MVAFSSRVLAAALFALTLGGTALAEDTAGDPANGKLIYAKMRCFTCHGRAGQGGGFNYPVPPLAALELPVEAFQAFLREPPNDMPAFSTAVTCVPHGSVCPSMTFLICRLMLAVSESS